MQTCNDLGVCVIKEQQAGATAATIRIVEQSKSEALKPKLVGLKAYAFSS